MSNAIKSDLHIHSQFSDGKLSIRQIIDLYGSKGFGAIAITDHLCERATIIGRVSHHLNFSLSRKSFSKYMDTIRLEAAYALEKYQMVVIPGFEITKNSFVNQRSAHILVLGVEEFIDPESPVEEILETAKSLGGLTIAAHPFYTGEFEFQSFYLWSRREKIRHLIDAWEFNYRKNICNDVLSSGLPLIANSDFHHSGHFSSWKTKIFSEPRIEDIFASIRSQNLDFFLDFNEDLRNLNAG